MRTDILKNKSLKRIPDNPGYDEDYMQDDTYDDYENDHTGYLTGESDAEEDTEEGDLDRLPDDVGKDSEDEGIPVHHTEDYDVYSVSDIDDDTDPYDYIVGTHIRRYNRKGKLRFIAKASDYLESTRDEHIPAFAAQSAFFLFLSFFPIISLVLTFTDIFPFSKDELLRVIYQVIPADFEPLILQIVNDIYQNASSSVAVISFIIALWSAAKGFMSIRDGLNEVYRARDNRNYVVARSISMIYTAVFIVILVALILLNIFGRQIAVWLMTKYPDSRQVTIFVYSFRSFASFVVVFVLLVMMYSFVPNRKLHVARQIAGAMFAAFAWVGIARLFSIFIDHYLGHSSVYGSLTTVVLVMIWLYYVCFMIFIGGMINEFIYEYYYRSRKLKKRLKTDIRDR